MPRMMRSRYLYGFLIAATILAAVGVAILISTQRFRADSQWVSHTYDVLRRLDHLHSVVQEGISSQRSYLLTGRREYDAEFQRTRPLFRKEAAELAVLVDDNPAQSASLSKLGVLIEQRLDVATEATVIYRREGLPAAQFYSQHSRGFDLMQDIQGLVAAMSAVEQRLLAVRTARSDRSAMWLLIFGAAGIPTSLVLLAWIYVLLSREVQQRGHAETRALELNTELARNVGGLEQATGDLRELSRYAGLLQTCRNLPEALDVTRRTLSALLADCAGSVYLLRASQDYAEIETSWNVHAAPPHALMLPHECWALRRSRPHYVDDLAEGMACTHVDAPHDGVAATACLPLTAQGMSLGVIYLSTHAHGPLPRIEIALAAAEQLSLALSNLRLQESLRQQSIRDALSGLYNRRYLLESLPRELARVQRRGQSLALMMLDLDHFKTFNDTHGHDGGDAIIAAFGRLLQSMSRDEDIPCRYGGEEFTLILPEVDAVTALRRADEIRAALSALTVRHLQRDIGRLTVSIGVAMAPEHGTEPELLQRRADEALYRAKRAGRNCVQMARVESEARNEEREARNE